MNAEPIYCMLCGAEDYSCGHTSREESDSAPRYCHTCGVPSDLAVCRECKREMGGGE